MSTEYHKRQWTAEELAAYHRDELSPMDSFELESDALMDPMLADALDAAVEHDLSLGKSEMDETWYKEVTEIPSKVASKSKWTPVRGILTLAMVVFVSWSVWNIWMNQKEIEELHRELADGSSENDRLNDRYQDSLKLLEITLAQPIPEPQQIDADMTISNQQAQESARRTNERDYTHREDRPMDSINALKPDGLDASPSPSLKVSAFPITYINELKVADYRNVHVETSFAFPGLLTGTPAAMEKEIGVSQIDGLNLTYHQLLSKALRSFVEKDYKNTIVMLDRISERLPRDENAIFYKALCYYNLGKWNKASALFGQAQLHENRVFDEEAEYYRALSKWQDGEQEEALRLFGIIALNKGFYGDKASRFLEK